MTNKIKGSIIMKILNLPKAIQNKISYQEKHSEVKIESEEVIQKKQKKVYNGLPSSTKFNNEDK